MMDETLIDIGKADLDLWCKLPICGCGNPPALIAAYHVVLASTPKPWSGDSTREWLSYDEKVARADAAYDPDGEGQIDEFLYHVIANVLDHIGATEHGGTINYAWLTDDGQRLLSLFEIQAEHEYEADFCYDLKSVVPGPKGKTR